MGMATRALLFSLIFLLLNVTVTSTALANDAADNNSTIDQIVDVQSPATDLWRAVRQRNVDITGKSQVKGPTANTLINVSGQEWREFRRTKLIPYSAYALGGVLLAIILFRLIRGKIKIKAGRSGNKIRRFSGFQRLVHWSVAISFLILGLTGILLTLGRFGLIPVIGKDAFGAVAILGRTVHNYIGPVFAVLLIIMLFTFIKGNFANWTDIKWFAKGGGLFGGHASAGRYNGGEKAWYWMAMIVGSVVIVSGIILGFPFFEISQEDIKFSQIVHAIAAIGLLAASFGHIYMGTIAMEGAYEAMKTGYCDENWAKEHHDLWYEELKSDGVIGSGGSDTGISNETSMRKQVSGSQNYSSQDAVASVASTAAAGVAATAVNATTAVNAATAVNNASTSTEDISDTEETVEVNTDKPSENANTTSAESFDNLKKIEGIGPKIEEVLYAAGLTRYEDIKNSDRDALKEILNAAGSRYKMHEPKSWPEQAALAAKGSWDELTKLQNDILNNS